MTGDVPTVTGVPCDFSRKSYFHVEILDQNTKNFFNSNGVFYIDVSNKLFFLSTVIVVLYT